MRTKTKTTRTAVLSAAALIAAVTLSGCATEHPQPAVAWSPGVIRPLNAPCCLPAEATNNSWVATLAPGESDRWLASRRNGSLTAPSLASMIDTSVWPGGPTQPKAKRIPVIYSRWGTSY